MERGWLKLWRRSIDSAAFADPHLWQLWCWILIRANRISRAIPVRTGRGQTVVTLQPGQFIFGRHTASKALKCPGSTIQYRLKTLKRLGMVDIQTATHYSVVTVVNWARYQENTPAIRQATRHPSVTDKKLEKESTTGANTVRPVLTYYSELFKAKVGQEPDINSGKDGKILKELIATRGEEAVRDLLSRFFSSPDPFIRQSGYTIGVFKACLNKILATGSTGQREDYEGTGGRRLESLI